MISWHNLGVVVPPGRSAYGPSIKASLHPSVDSVYVYFFGIGSDLTVATFQFNLSDEVRLDQMARVDQETTIRTTSRKGWIQYEGPFSKKQRALDAERRRIRHELQAWVTDRIPGAFSGEVADDEFPSCEFISFRKADPCQEDRDDIYGWQRLFRIDTDWHTWKSGFLGPALLRPPDGHWRSGDARYRIELLANETALVDAIDLDGYGGETIQAVMSRSAIPMSQLMALWATTSLLDAWERRLGQLRDAFGDIKRTGRDSSRGQSLLEGRSAVQMLGYDIGLAAPALRRIAKRSDHLLGDFPDFLEASRHLISYYEDVGGEPQELRERLFDRLKYQARTVERTAATLKETVGMESAIVASWVNLRLQRTLTWLTWVLVLLAIVTAAVAITSAGQT